MISHVLFFCLFCSLHVVSGQAPLERLLQQNIPCFDEVEVPAECDTTLAESFKSTYDTFEGSDPTTLMYLFTPDNPDAAEPLHKCGGMLPPESTYDPEADTEIFIHGWLDGVCRTAWMREMKEQLKNRGRYNVILVDWTWGNTFDYVTAGHNCRITGEQVGLLINNIMVDKDIGPEKFHVIGHSFGAIASGYVGRSVEGLRRITALDPAYAPYGTAPPNERVTYRDAQIVDVIHSNGFECYVEGIGDARPLGHADFYPNGGQFQSSCYKYLLISLLKLDVLYGIVSLDFRLCPHVQAIQFYKVSINSKGCEFIGVADSSYDRYLRRNGEEISRKDWSVMGMNYELYHKKDDKMRKYYLTTLNNCPYYDSSYLGPTKFPFKVNCKK